MLFNSFAFAVFLPIAFILYWAYFNQKNVKLRNGFLLAVSYIFYGWWDWRFLILIAITSFCSWGSGWLISTSSDASNDRKLGPKFWLVSNLILNLGILAVFKYFNFFVDSFVHILTAVGIPVHSTTTLNIVLPVGISFYTFQALSYGIDIYRKELEPTRDWLQFFAFVSFFPQLVAGPIERTAGFRGIFPNWLNIDPRFTR